ncbi:acyltransferase family protein [Stakelama tenebrarum]|uniref:Acyltransferase n=1 Tax=Stakelama tenebrarum TaxID=2711215 RepID=A0A6G6Y834_9SPHN|nr:acyltransferase [Sphingosinithalassobacter tenebrarum]QIG81102.1 acyltransferase [Sphingosinithalassobacter tenebrarum]
MSAKPELRALTSVRGIAALLVVFYHIRMSIAGLPQPLLEFFAKGYLAVDFFFLLSGFVIWLSYAQRLRDGGLAAIPTFLKRRVARIWPLHLFVLAGGVALALLLAATGRHDANEFPFAQLPLHIFLLQNWGFTQGLSWNDPAWSISAELGAYLLFPLLAVAIDWRRIPGWAIIAAIVALALLLASVMAMGGAQTLGEDIARFGLLRCLIEFAAGNALCALWLRWRERPMVPAVAASLLALLCFAAWAAGMPETLAVPLAFAASLLALALTSGRRGNPLEGRTLHWLGEISYAVYLGHYLLWTAFKLAFVSDVGAVPPALIALYMAMVIVSAAMLYHWIERPAQRWINGLAPARRREPVARDAALPR